MTEDNKIIISFPIVECRMCGIRDWKNMSKVINAVGSYCAKCAPIAAIHADMAQKNKMLSMIDGGVISLNGGPYYDPRKETP